MKNLLDSIKGYFGSFWKEEHKTIINEETSVKIEKMVSKNDVEIHGTVVGDIIVEDGHSCIIGKTGRVEGNITAGEIIISGYIMGPGSCQSDIVSDGFIYITSSASVSANVIVAKTIIVDEGCFIDATFRISGNKEKSN